MNGQWSGMHVVYFLHVRHESSCVKIGYATDFAKRLRSHMASVLGMSVTVEPLCVVRGSRADEQAIHRHFQDHALDGEREVFRPSPAVLDYVRWLRDQHYAWVPDDPECTPEALEVVDSSFWMPSPERAKPYDAFALPGMCGPLSMPPRQLTADDFYTGPAIIEAARSVLGGIDLDPASHAIANRIVRAARFFAIGDDGLSRPWSGRVWLNPPFSQWASWVPKIMHEWQRGEVMAMLTLAATRTLTAQYFAPIREGCAAMCVLNGRIPFWGARAGSPDDGHAVFYFGMNIGRFETVFGEMGTVFLR